MKILATFVIAFIVLLPTATIATPLDAQSKKLLFASLIEVCFKEYRNAMGQNVSNVQIINLCECASAKSADRMTQEDLGRKNQTKLVQLMQSYGTICGGDIFLPSIN